VGNLFLFGGGRRNCRKARRGATPRDFGVKKKGGEVFLIYCKAGQKQAPPNFEKRKGPTSEEEGDPQKKRKATFLIGKLGKGKIVWGKKKNNAQSPPSSRKCHTRQERKDPGKIHRHDKSRVNAY